MSYYLCVDCGASKTAAAIADHDGKIVGRGYAGPSNPTYQTLDAFTEAVRLACAEALAAASLPAHFPPPGASILTAAWIGASGADSQAVIAKITPCLTKLTGIPVGPNLLVSHDTYLLAAPIRLHDDVSQAVTIIGGTGSVVVAFKEEHGEISECARAGGWGWMLGDAGSGFDVGREALRQILFSHEQGAVQKADIAPSTLRDKVLAKFGVTDVMEVLSRVYRSDPPSDTVAAADAPVTDLVREKRISKLSPIVFEAAFVDHDPLAMKVLKNCAQSLVDSVLTVVGVPTVERPRLVNPNDAIISFGGSLVAIEGYRRLILEDLAGRGFTFRRELFVDDAAVAGALSLATKYKYHK